MFAHPSRGAILEADRGSPDDLAVSGLFKDLPDGGTGHLTRNALAALPGRIKLHEQLKPELPLADLSVLPLTALLEAVPLADRADGLVLIGADGWESFLPLGFIRKHHPYLLLYYDGRAPAEGWPKIYGTKPLAPYFSNISPSLGPPVDSPLEYGYNDANQIVEIRGAVARDRYAPFYRDKLSSLSGPAGAGRKIFLQECNNCHQGPGQVGGNVSHRSFGLLCAQATFNPDYFMSFVRNPAKYVPDTVMSPYDQMSRDWMDQLVAFLREARAAGAN